MKRIIINVEGDINDRLSSMEYLNQKMSPIGSLTLGDSVSLDLEKLHYIGPDGIAIMAGSILMARRSGITVNVRVPHDPIPLAAFLNFSGFNHLILGAPMPEINHQENVTVPLRQFGQSHQNDPDPIIELVGKFEQVSDNLRRSLQIAVNECIQNVEDHSHSPIGAISCARFMTQQREVRIAILDWGKGIFSTLQRKYPNLQSSQQALESVLFGGVSAQSRPNNLGRGIDNLRMVVTTAFGGDLSIVSYDAAVYIHGHQTPKYRIWPYAYPGTAIFFTLPVEPRN